MKILTNPVVVILLAVLAGVAGGLLPVWQGVQVVIAQRRAIKAEQVAKHEEQKAQGWDFWTIEIENLATELKDERARLRQVAEQLDARAARIAADQQELDKLRLSLEAMRKEIGDRIVEIKADELKNLKNLAQSYTNLSPKGAVGIIKELDDNTAVKILALMKPDVVGPIFDEMGKAGTADPTLAKRAAVLSEKLRLMKAVKTAATP